MKSRRLPCIFLLFGSLMVNGCATLPGDALRDAALNGDLASAKQAVAAGADVNWDTSVIPWGDSTPLQLAARHGHIEMMRYLLENGADINHTSDYGTIALHHAAANGQTEAVKFLVTAGSDINALSIYKQTPLHYCGIGSNPNVEVVNYLIAAGADTRIRDTDGMTAQQRASWKGYPAIAAAIAESETQQAQKQQQNALAQHQQAEQSRQEAIGRKQLVTLKQKQSCNLRETDWAYLGSNCKAGFAHGRGKAQNPVTELTFEGSFIDGARIEGVIYHQNEPLFEGKINQGKPDGNGICYHQNEPEECRYYKGKRIDGLYKQRMELAVQQQYMEMLKLQMEKMKQQGTAANAQGSITDTARDALMKEAGDRVIGKIFDHLF